MSPSVPGHNVEDALVTRPSLPIDDLTDLLLGLPGLLGGVSRSQVEWAEALHPTTVLVWIGNNDVLGAALAADPSLVTPVPQFHAEYTELMNRLEATGAALVWKELPRPIRWYFRASSRPIPWSGMWTQILGEQCRPSSPPTAPPRTAEVGRTFLSVPDDGYLVFAVGAGPGSICQAEKPGTLRHFHKRKERRSELRGHPPPNTKPGSETTWREIDRGSILPPCP